MHPGSWMPVRSCMYACQLLLMRARARRAYCKKCRVHNKPSKSLAGQILHASRRRSNALACMAPSEAPETSSRATTRS
jgi:hypothetical protein